MKRGPYKTKKRKEEFRKAYEEIGDLNLSILNAQIEIDCFLKTAQHAEIKIRRDMIEKAKNRLEELKKMGWDIEYTSTQVSGLYTNRPYPELT